MARVVVIGGGWAGCSAALAAKKAGAGEVLLLERTDMLLGTGLAGGIMRNNGRFTAAEELMALGAGELIGLADRAARHRNIDFPGHRHATLYDVVRMEPLVRALLEETGIDIYLEERGIDVIARHDTLEAVVTSRGRRIEGDVFVDATGSFGPQNNCTRYGNGCVMCIMRCPAFGGRVSIAAKLGIPEQKGVRPGGGLGAFSGSCKLNKDSLAADLRRRLEEEGVVVLRIPAPLRKGKEVLTQKACQQYALEEYLENLVLLDTGHAKLMTPFLSLRWLRQIPGLEQARYEDPYAGGRGNSVRFLAITPRDNTLKVVGTANLFCAGEKAGLFVGHTEAMVTGTLAGHNAARMALRLPLLELPRCLAVGELIAFGRERMEQQGLTERYTFSGSVFFRRMQELGLYTTDVTAIRRRVQETGLGGIFQNPAEAGFHSRKSRVQGELN